MPAPIGVPRAVENTNDRWLDFSDTLLAGFCFYRH